MVAFIETDDGLQRQHVNAAEIGVDGGHHTPLWNRDTIESGLFGEESCCKSHGWKNGFSPAYCRR